MPNRGGSSKRRRRSVHKRSSGRSGGRGDTVYVVYRLAYREARVLADLELVGFAKARKRERAIKKVAEGDWGDTDGYPEEFVAVPMRDLVPYLQDGRQAGEVPSFEIEPQ